MSNNNQPPAAPPTINQPQLNPGQVIVWNGQNAQWITVPVNTTNGAGVITITAGNPGQIELDLPTEPQEKKKVSDGCSCKKCEEYFPYAEPNQEDGTLVCYACRHGL